MTAINNASVSQMALISDSTIYTQSNHQTIFRNRIGNKIPHLLHLVQYTGSELLRYIVSSRVSWIMKDHTFALILWNLSSSRKTQMYIHVFAFTYWHLIMSCFETGYFSLIIIYTMYHLQRTVITKTSGFDFSLTLYWYNVPMCTRLFVLWLDILAL